jgi:hypothetical protein
MGLVTSMSVGLRPLAGFVIAALGACAAAPAVGQTFSLQHPHGYELEVAANGRARPVMLVDTLAGQLAGADVAFLVGGGVIRDHGHLQLLLAVSNPSRQNRAAGYCGSGTEDKLVLLGFDPPASARTLDVLPLQSCLNDFLLDSDQGVDLAQMLGRITDPKSFELAWEEHPKYGSGKKQVEIKNGKFHVSLIQGLPHPTPCLAA